MNATIFQNVDNKKTFKLEIALQQIAEKSRKRYNTRTETNRTNVYTQSRNVMIDMPL